MMLMLDRIIQMPSAMVKMVDNAFGIATRIMPTIIDKIPDIMPWNGM